MSDTVARVWFGSLFLFLVAVCVFDLIGAKWSWADYGLVAIACFGLSAFRETGNIEKED